MKPRTSLKVECQDDFHSFIFTQFHDVFILCLLHGTIRELKVAFQSGRILKVKKTEKINSHNRANIPLFDFPHILKKNLCNLISGSNICHNISFGGNYLSIILMKII